jgi:hypothetical protein
MYLKTVLLFFISFLTSALYAQTSQISGRIVDNDKLPIPGVNVIVTSVSDSTKQFIAVTGKEGYFKVTGLQKGNYRFKATFLGYRNINRILNYDGSGLNMGQLSMKEKVTNIAEVQINGYIPPAVQKGDTSEMRADAVKVNRDATTEDLVKKMPGITNDNGTIKSQGEEIKKVLVDGKPFFGDDPSLALKNLPAEVVDKVQVFNKMSDQAQLTGFDDGNSVRTMNIITKQDRRNGLFGKLYAGSDFKDKYMAGGNLNYFKGDQRFTILGLTNNVNQQNFAAQDLFGSGGGRGMGSFMVGPQSGITKTNSIGLNYSGSIGKKLTLSGSYFFNNTRTNSTEDINREYIQQDYSNKSYSESSNTLKKNYNHRLNLRLEYAIDSLNTLIMVPSLSFQTNNSDVKDLKTTILTNGGSIISSQQTGTDLNGYSLSNQLIFRHKFAKAGRSVSLGVTTSANKKNSDNTNNYTTIESQDTIPVSQYTDGKVDGYTVSSNLAYTEPVGKRGIIQLAYNTSYTKNNTDKETYNLDATGLAQERIDSLSNVYNNHYITNRGGVSYRYRNQGFNLALGVDYQRADLTGHQTYPSSTEVRKTFDNFLPNMMLNYKISQKTNLRVFYRASTNAPSISQLQNVIDNSNSLILSTGNPNLKQEYSHNIFGRFSTANPTNATNFFLMFGGGYTLNNIGTQTITAKKDTLIQDVNVLLKQGIQLSRPVNLDHSWNFNTMGSYGFPIPLIKSNLNLMSGFTYTITPGYVGEELNRSKSSSITNGLVLSSNVSEDVDFTVSYNSNYNMVRNTIQNQSKTTYWYQTAGLSFNWVIWNGIVLRNDVTGQFNRGLSSNTYNQNYVLWNASLAKKLFKSQKGEIKLSLYDILNQNKDISRTVNAQYIQDSRSNVLKQYVLLTFTYTFREFGQQGRPRGDRDFDGPPMGPPPGGGDRRMGPPPGGGGGFHPPMMN